MTRTDADRESPGSRVDRSRSLTDGTKALTTPPIVSASPAEDAGPELCGRRIIVGGYFRGLCGEPFGHDSPNNSRAHPCRVARATPSDVVRAVLAKSRATVAALTAEHTARLAAEQERDAAVEWIGVVRDTLTIRGYPGGDRSVGMANFRALLQETDRLRAELRRLSDGPELDTPGGY
jgi:hypothetical protein